MHPRNKCSIGRFTALCFLHLHWGCVCFQEELLAPSVCHIPSVCVSVCWDLMRVTWVNNISVQLNTHRAIRRKSWLFTSSYTLKVGVFLMMWLELYANRPTLVHVSNLSWNLDRFVCFSTLYPVVSHPRLNPSVLFVHPLLPPSAPGGFQWENSGQRSHMVDYDTHTLRLHSPPLFFKALSFCFPHVSFFSPERERERFRLRLFADPSGSVTCKFLIFQS